jgi:hypothetical protein
MTGSFKRSDSKDLGQDWSAGYADCLIDPISMTDMRLTVAAPGVRLVCLGVNQVGHTVVEPLDGSPSTSTTVTPHFMQCIFLAAGHYHITSRHTFLLFETL